MSLDSFNLREDNFIVPLFTPSSYRPSRLLRSFTSIPHITPTCFPSPRCFNNSSFQLSTPFRSSPLSLSLSSFSTSVHQLSVHVIFSLHHFGVPNPLPFSFLQSHDSAIILHLRFEDSSLTSTFPKFSPKINSSHPNSSHFNLELLNPSSLCTSLHASPFPVSLHQFRLGFSLQSFSEFQLEPYNLVPY